MAKKSETVATAASSGFKRIAAVTLPCLKHAEGTTIAVMFDAPMMTTPKMKKGVAVLDEDGNPASITTARVVDLTTGELGTLVVGAMLKSEIERYKGGGNAYVGLCFEIEKSAAKAGTRAKTYRVFEIENPTAI